MKLIRGLYLLILFFAIASCNVANFNAKKNYHSRVQTVANNPTIAEDGIHASVINPVLFKTSQTNFNTSVTPQVVIHQIGLAHKGIESTVVYHHKRPFPQKVPKLKKSLLGVKRTSGLITGLVGIFSLFFSVPALILIIVGFAVVVPVPVLFWVFWVVGMLASIFAFILSLAATIEDGEGFAIFGMVFAFLVIALALVFLFLVVL